MCTNSTSTFALIAVYKRCLVYNGSQSDSSCQWSNAGLIVAQRLRRWPTINPALVDWLSSFCGDSGLFAVHCKLKHVASWRQVFISHPWSAKIMALCVYSSLLKPPSYSLVPFALRVCTAITLSARWPTLDVILWRLHRRQNQQIIF